MEEDFSAVVYFHGFFVERCSAAGVAKLANRNEIGIHFAKEEDGFGVGWESGDGEFSYVCVLYVLLIW